MGKVVYYVLIIIENTISTNISIIIKDTVKQIMIQ